MDKPYVLPPLKRSRERVIAKGWLEDKVSRFDAFLMRAVAHPLPWWRAVFYWFLRKIVTLTYYFGRVYPYLFRPWNRIARFATYRLDRRIAKKRYETARTLFLRRLFSSQRLTDGRFHTPYAVWNWLGFLFLIWFSGTIVETFVEGIYVYSTFGTYHDVIVTQAYRNITDQSTYAIHGYQLVDGEKKEFYFELGPNIWYWNLYPEFMFGKIPVLGRCTFETYGITLRIPKRLRLFSAGSLYILNPWIVDLTCIPPTIVPGASSGD